MIGVYRSFRDGGTFCSHLINFTYLICARVRARASIILQLICCVQCSHAMPLWKCISSFKCFVAVSSLLYSLHLSTQPPHLLHPDADLLHFFVSITSKATESLGLAWREHWWWCLGESLSAHKTLVDSHSIDGNTNESVHVYGIAWPKNYEATRTAHNIHHAMTIRRNNNRPYRGLNWFWRWVVRLLLVASTQSHQITQPGNRWYVAASNEKNRTLLINRKWQNCNEVVMATMAMRLESAHINLATCRLGVNC